LYVNGIEIPIVITTWPNTNATNAGKIRLICFKMVSRTEKMVDREGNTMYRKLKL